MTLDARLSRWAARHEPSPGHLDRLAARVVVAAASRRHASAVAPARSGALFAVKLGYALTGAVVAGVVFWGLGSRPSPSGPRHTGSAGAAQLATLTAEQASAMGHLFAESTRLFPKRLRWVTQSNGDMGLGVEATDQDWTDGKPPLLVRLVVVSRTGRETTWRRAWSTDVVLRGEDLAEIVPNRDSANKLTLWVYPLQDGRMAVDTSVELDHPLRITSRLHAVVKDGEPTEVAAVRMGETEYRLFQTVEPLHDRKERKT